MQKSELFEIIANGENSGIEFKRDDIRPEDLAKEIVAMLNFQGGRVLLGVEDDGEISGIKRENLEEWVMNVVRDKIHPTVLPYFEKIKIDDNHFVAVITFPIGNSKPYVRRHSGKEEIFIRVGSTSRTATREEQMRLFELGGMLHTELLPVPRTNIESLDLARIENYLKDIIKDPDVPETKPEWKERLKGLGFITENNGNLYCTIAGLILFGKNPRKYLKQSGIRLFVFNSNNKEYKAVLDTIIDAPLVARWNITETERTLIDDGLIERFIEIISSYIN
ncbi:MAG: RNA-binding domain-containing protein, partial [Candidatus Muiribacteriota bacterium]